MNLDRKILDSTEESYDVSVCVLTYNKEDYIAQAIESVLMQKTTCSYEIVIGDNASTDKTQEIICDYWKRDPKRFSILMNNENLGLTANVFHTFSKAKGKYIVLLYGDNYWISDEKMQRQFDFLERETSCIGVTAETYSIYNGETTPIVEKVPRAWCDKMFTLDYFLKGERMATCGVMFRNSVFRANLDHFYKTIQVNRNVDDLAFDALLLMKGNVFQMGRPTDANRVNRPEDNVGNYGASHTDTEKNKDTISSLKNLENLTDGALKLERRASIVLGNMFLMKCKGMVSLEEYKEIESMIVEHWGNKRFRMLAYAAFRKIEQKLRKKVVL